MLSKILLALSALNQTPHFLRSLTAPFSATANNSMSCLFYGSSDDAEIGPDHAHVLELELDLLIQCGQIQVVEPAPGIATQKTRGHVNQDLIDQPGLQKDAAEPWPTFNVNFIHTALDQKVELKFQDVRMIGANLRIVVRPVK